MQQTKEKINIDFDGMLIEYSRTLLGCISTRIVSQHDKEDILHDVFYEFIKSGKNFESEKHFKNWLHRVTDNKVNSFLRKMYRHNEEIAEEFDSESLATDEINIDDAVDIAEAIKKLPARQAEITYLHYFEDMTSESIAMLLGLDAGSVRASLKSARKNLEKHLSS